MHRGRYNVKIVAVLVLLAIRPDVMADEFCGLDLNENGSFAEEGETSLCEPTMTNDIYSCPIGRVECASVEIPVSSCMPYSTRINEQEQKDGLPLTTRFSALDLRRLYCPVTNTIHDVALGHNNPSLKELALLDRRCALDCDGDPDIIKRTAWFSPISGNETCLNLLDSSMTDSPTDCFEKTLDPSVDPIEYNEDNSTFEPVSGQCEGEFQIFSGKPSSCRTNGTQTRWDNCCNNGDKIITDSFSEKTILEQVEEMANMVGGMFGKGSDVEKVIREGFAIIPNHIDMVAITGKVANWLMTPCAKESVDVSKMASDMCVYIGRRCVEKWFGIGCVQHAEVHCCFNTKLGKIFHEQAREQLPGLDWGTANDANCRGFTPEEFTSLDFSKIDLGEYEPEISHRSSDDMEEYMTDGLPEIP